MNKTICKSDSVLFNLNQTSEKYNIYRDTVSFLTDSALFSKEDFDFFRIQIKKNEEFQWNDSLLNGAKVIPQSNLKRIFKKKKGWKKFNKKYGNCLSSFSMPIFDINFKYCIVQIGTQCDWLEGRGVTNVYKYTNGEWVFFKNYSMWVS